MKREVIRQEQESDDGLFDPGWECTRCDHLNDDGAEDCTGPKCVAFRAWATEENAEDPS